EEWPWMGVMAYWFFKRASDSEQDQPWYYFKMLNPDFTPMPVYEAMKQYAKQPPAIYPGYFQEDHWAIRASGTWNVERDQRAVLGNYRVSEQSGAALSFNFVGTGLDVVFVKGASGGVARITIDERAPTEINFDSAQAVFGEKTPIARGLPKGRHTARVEVASGAVGVDAVIVYR
ncbi:MAG: hypothetical protein LC737_04360, partial [Chloroflexi bacterium]|nr:hypothetical protein [Chloroflexota bacterium]